MCGAMSAWAEPEWRAGMKGGAVISRTLRSRHAADSSAGYDAVDSAGLRAWHLADAPAASQVPLSGWHSPSPCYNGAAQWGKGLHIRAVPSAIDQWRWT